MGKSVIDSEAISFLTQTEQGEAIEEPKEAVKPTRKKSTAKKHKPVKEKKDYRINLALTKSMGEQIEQEAYKSNRSVNGFIEIIIGDYLNKH